MGGLGGPTAVGIDSGLRNQAKNAAVQEWTQWKQWALNHKDFPAFREKIQSKAQDHNRNVDVLLTRESTRNEIEQLCQEERNWRARLFRRALIFIVFTGFVYLVALGKVTININREPKYTEDGYPIQSVEDWLRETDKGKKKWGSD